MWIRRHSELLFCAVVTLGAAVARVAPASAATTEDDPLVDYRERFKKGMDRYVAGAVAEAIGYWDPLYRQLGPQRGYRLAYNLGVSYAQLGDATRAAERLQGFLDELDSRKSRGEPPEPIVAKEEADARQRIVALTAAKGRIRIKAGDRPIAVQIDASEPRLAGFVAWVPPGQHMVTFAPETSAAETTRVVANVGEIVEIEPPAALVAAPPHEPPAGPILEPAPAQRRALLFEARRPFSPWVLFAAAGVDIAASVTAIALESHASALRTQFTASQSESGTISPADRQRFDEARTWAYSAVGGTAAVGVVTIGLVAWYIFGSSRSPVTLQPVVMPEKGGAVAGAVARF